MNNGIPFMSEIVAENKEIIWNPTLHHIHLKSHAYMHHIDIIEAVILMILNFFPDIFYLSHAFSDCVDEWMENLLADYIATVVGKISNEIIVTDV